MVLKEKENASLRQRQYELLLVNGNFSSRHIAFCLDQAAPVAPWFEPVSNAPGQIIPPQPFLSLPPHDPAINQNVYANAVQFTASAVYFSHHIIKRTNASGLCRAAATLRALAAVDAAAAQQCDSSRRCHTRVQKKGSANTWRRRLLPHCSKTRAHAHLFSF